MEKSFLKYCLLGCKDYLKPFKGVKGVGKKKAQKILSVYSSVREVLDSGLNGLTQIKGIDHELADRIIKQLRKMEKMKFGYESYKYFAYAIVDEGRIRNFTAEEERQLIKIYIEVINEGSEEYERSGGKIQIGRFTPEEQKQLIRAYIEEQTRGTIRGIENSRKEWPKEYERRSQIEIENAKKIKERLLKKLSDLNESELKDVVTIASFWNVLFQKSAKVEASLKKRGDKDLLDLAGIVNPTNILKLPSPLYECYNRYYQWRRYGAIWTKKRRKIIRQRRKCEKCGSKKNLEVHHMQGLGSENPEDLQVLCREHHLKVTAERRKILSRTQECEICGISAFKRYLEVFSVKSLSSEEPQDKVLCRECHLKVMAERRNS